MKQNWVFLGDERRNAESQARASSAPFLISDFRLPSSESRLGDKSNQACRAISTGQLRASPRFHIRPIDVVVFHGSSRENLF
jgi:hypothetical protein